jgi:hypothetical protein
MCHQYWQNIVVQLPLLQDFCHQQMGMAFSSGNGGFRLTLLFCCVSVWTDHRYPFAWRKEIKNVWLCVYWPDLLRKAKPAKANGMMNSGRRSECAVLDSLGDSGHHVYRATTEGSVPEG